MTIKEIVCAALGFGLGVHVGIFMIAALAASGKFEEDQNDD
jgi:hypothetical protein